MVSVTRFQYCLRVLHEYDNQKSSILVETDEKFSVNTVVSWPSSQDSRRLTVIQNDEKLKQVRLKEVYHEIQTVD